MTRWKNPLLWFRGLLAGFIGGGAGAVTSGFISIAQTPEQYNLKGGLVNLLVMIGGSFLVVGILNAFAYLQKSPLPELEEYDTEHTTKPKDQ
jgi:hypothetical protein